MAGLRQHQQGRLLGGVFALAFAIAMCRLASEAFIGARKPATSFGLRARQLFVSQQATVEAEPTPVEDTRRELLKDLGVLASDLGVEASNKTRSTAEWQSAVESKVAALEQAGDAKASAFRMKYLQWEGKMVRAELSLVVDGLDKVTDVDVAKAVVAKVQELEKAQEAINERADKLEKSLAASSKRTDTLLNGLKEIGSSVGVGGIGGLFTFFMSDQDLIKETKSQIQSLQKSQR
jgi:hypothetical protein